MSARCYSTKQNAVENCVAEASLVYHTEPQIKKQKIEDTKQKTAVIYRLGQKSKRRLFWQSLFAIKWHRQVKQSKQKC